MANTFKMHALFPKLQNEVLKEGKNVLSFYLVQCFVYVRCLLIPVLLGRIYTLRIRALEKGHHNWNHLEGMFIGPNFHNRASQAKSELGVWLNTHYVHYKLLQVLVKFELQWSFLEKISFL